MNQAFHVLDCINLYFILFSVYHGLVRMLGIFHVLGLGPSIKGLVTYGNTKLCCRGFILALFQSTTANKIDS